MLIGKLKTQGSGSRQPLEHSLRVAVKSVRPPWPRDSPPWQQAAPLQCSTLFVLASLGQHCQEAHSSTKQVVTQGFWVCEPAQRSAQQAYHPLLQSLVWLGVTSSLEEHPKIAWSPDTCSRASERGDLRSQGSFPGL